MTTYSTDYQIKLIGDGEEAGTWGDSTNENWDRIGSAIGGSSVIDVTVDSGGSTWATPVYTWLTSNTSDTGDAGSEGRSGVVIFKSSGAIPAEVEVNIRGNTNLLFPDRVFIVKNSLAGSSTIKFDLGSSDDAGDFILENDKSAVIFTSATAKGGGEIAANSVINALADLQLKSVTADGDGFVGGLLVPSGELITTNTINETTAASGVTIDSVLLKDGAIETGAWEGDAITGAYIDATTSPLANTKIWIGSASNVAAEFALSGDATMTAGGAVTVSTAAACSGNAATSTLASTVTVIDSTDSTAFPALFDSATGSLAIKTDAANLTYDASSGVLTAAGFVGPLTGNASGSSGSTTGNAATATKLATARAINGVDFNGTIPITVTAAAGTLTGATLAAGVTASSLTSFGSSPALGIPASGTLTNCTGLPVSTGVSGLGSGVATFLATPSSANLASAVTGDTGSGALVFATSPTLVTPLLGTPTSGTLTNCTGLPVSTGVSGLGTGVGTFLGTPSSANLASAVTGETGSGALVFATSPTLVTPALGTPSAGVLSSCTAYPGDSSLVTTGTVATGTWSSDITMGAGDNLEVDGGTIKLNGDYPSSGNYNAALGFNALDSITDGTNNVSIGRNSGKDLTTEDQNVFVGVSAGENVCSTGETEGDNNTFVGHQSGFGVDTATTASDNSGIGSCSLESITTGTHNTFLGRRSGYTLTEGTYNCGIGYDSGDDITSGAGNTFIGTKAGQGVQSGDYNVTIGYRSGDSDGANTLGDNKLVIHSESGGTADPANDALIYGDFSAGTLQVNAPGTGASSSNTFTVNNASATYTGDVLSVEASDAAGYNLISASANGARVFKVDATGATYNDANIYGTPADYADMFEWADGNPDAEDRIGLSVVLDGEGGIRIATGSDAAEDVVGIVSGTACMVGNAAWNAWDKTFLKDDFGRPTDQPNPDYDESLEYVPRGDRAEWAIIGLTGRVHLRKGSPANPLWRKIRDVSAVTEEWLVR